jgi:thioredoxin reductase (NADPH)
MTLGLLSEHRRPRAPIVVVGAGAAGLAAASELARLGLDATVIERSAGLGGQLATMGNLISDLPGAAPCTGREVIGRLAQSAKSQRVRIVREAQVVGISPEERLVHLPDRSLRYAAVIAASGRTHRRLPADRHGVLGHLSATRDGHRYAGMHVVVVGGGDRAVESSIILERYGANVTLVHRGGALCARRSLAGELADTPAEVRLKTEVAALERLGPEHFAVTLSGPGGEETLEAATVFVRIGMQPVTEWLGMSDHEAAPDALPVDGLGRTAIPGVWAAGDMCLSSGVSGLMATLGTAVVAAKSAARALQYGSEDSLVRRPGRSVARMARASAAQSA